ncbi:MAG: hypothetical protein HF973_09435 [Chloroflexi bacterium]|nr:hypothetical protein [Chloroflexota bacterium]
MHDISGVRRIYYGYLGRALALTYITQRRTFLGLSWAGWLKLFTLALFLAAWLLRWPRGIVLAALALAVWVWFSYWRARHMEFNKFVADETAAAPDDSPLSPLNPNHKVPLYASGVFAVKDRESFVLLRPAEFWYVPLGDHVIMVEQFTKSYLYQFFDARTLLQVQAGWLLFGKRPLHTLKLTFLEQWGEAGEEVRAHTLENKTPAEKEKLPQRTVYLTFDTHERLNLVWHTIQKNTQKSPKTDQ